VRTWFTVTKVGEAHFSDEPAAPFFFLPVGNDGRTGDTISRGEAIHLIGVNPAAHAATILDIPRDTAAEIPGYGSDKINSRAQLDLDRVVRFLVAHPSAKVLLLGFSDSSGDAYRNLQLSRQRARTIAKELEMRGVHPESVEGFGAAMPIEKRLALKAQYPDPEHPVVRTHPETGEKVLFVNGFTTHFTNFHTPDNVRYGQDYTQGASALLQYLINQAAIPEYQVRWRWQPNSVAIWDNRATQHYAVMDYPPCHRKMERAGIIGTPTF